MSTRAALCLLAAATLALGCTKKADSGAPDTSSADGTTGAPAASVRAAPPAAAAPAGPAGANVIGPAAIAAWDALPNRAMITSFPSLYLHQSVGQDLEDGAAAAGFPFTYYGPDQAAGSVAAGLNGGLFADVGPIDNGKPISKIAIVRREFRKQKGKLKVLSFSFGYADVMDTVDDGRPVSLAEVFTAYKALVDEVKAAGTKFVHVTPPLVFDPTTNPPKMQLRKLMLDTFKDDRIFDLTDIESFDSGKRCEKGGIWHICQANRSTATCPSKGQGVDTDGQGHLCEKRAAQISKALLFAIHSAGK